SSSSPFSFAEPKTGICFSMPTAAIDNQGLEEQGDSWPPWLKPLLGESFFMQCKEHADSHRSECNMYCLDCMDGALCPICLLTNHKNHCSIQIRRSSYHDVIRLTEIQKVIDVTGVQTYIINGARVVFLNERPQPRPGKTMANNTCEVCDRSLHDSSRFCSLGCKVVGTSKNFARKKEEKIEPIRSWDSGESYGGHGRLKANRYGFSPSTPPSATPGYRIAKRRKGIPHRAPMGCLMIE
ncbi:hypothetical protein SAY86_000077, partial [Trapa natans]